jgi:hypothetical protein
MVFVLSSDGQPLDPCHPARARQVLRRGRARVVRRFPMTIQLLDRRADQSTTHPLRLKIDPGSRTTGLALMTEESATVVWAAELTHRSTAIRDALLARRAFRRAPPASYALPPGPLQQSPPARRVAGAQSAEPGGSYADLVSAAGPALSDPRHQC